MRLIRYKRREWLGIITENSFLIAVAGSHGKSTTSAMLALALRDIEIDVSAVIGADVPQFPGSLNAVVGSSNTFVLEADEYDSCFLGVSPNIAVVLNVEWEHVDMFPSESAVMDVFKEFVSRVRPGGSLVVCGDSTAVKLRTDNSFDEKGISFVTYGLGEGNDWRATNLTRNDSGGTDYSILYNGRSLGKVRLPLPGIHLVLNSLAVVAAAALYSTHYLHPPNDSDRWTAVQRSFQETAASLAKFRGIGRRFEVKGEINGCTVVDDYAHHPTEVKATLEAARHKYTNHVVLVVFQPHTYSRLAALIVEFSAAFSEADKVFVSEVYASREENRLHIGSADLAAQIVGSEAHFIPSQDEILTRLLIEIAQFQRGNSTHEQSVLVLILGAGNITDLGPRLLGKLQQ